MKKRRSVTREVSQVKRNDYPSSVLSREDDLHRVIVRPLAVYYYRENEKRGRKQKSVPYF